MLLFDFDFFFPKETLLERQIRENAICKEKNEIGDVSTHASFFPPVLYRQRGSIGAVHLARKLYFILAVSHISIFFYHHLSVRIILAQ